MIRRIFISLTFVIGFFIQVSAGNTEGVGTEIGDTAPEVIEQSVDGKILKLSDLRGQVVLIDFWASWCTPCRKENANVVKAYKKYKDSKFKKNGKGFTVFSVSLDKTKEEWKKAIREDNLSWEYHVSDLKYKSSEYAYLYDVHSIPSNFLINGDGVIIAKNLRGDNLLNTLKELEK